MGILFNASARDVQLTDDLFVNDKYIYCNASPKLSKMKRKYLLGCKT